MTPNGQIAIPLDTAAIRELFCSKPTHLGENPPRSQGREESRQGAAVSGLVPGRTSVIP